MGGSIDRRDRIWQTALATEADLEVGACAMHTVHRDYRLDDRVLDQHICNLITSESVIVEVGGRRRTLIAGSALWINPGVMHSLRLTDPARPFSMLNLRFRVRHAGRAIGFATDALLVDEAQDLRPLWEMALDDRLQTRPDRPERLRHILALLHSDLTRRDAADGTRPGLGRHRRQALARWMASHLHQRPTPADLAAVVGLSPDWFRRAFTTTFGCSPRAWIVRERIHAAAQRLADKPGLTVAELASQLGYDDYRLFDRQFRSVLGTSPSVWRRN
jgi:AraC-like DNA-binding protein